MKRKESKCAICYKFYNIYEFGDGDISLGSCFFNFLFIKPSINNDGTHGYECHPQYKKSLFVNTAGPDEVNYFEISSYEVFTHN